MFVAEPEQMVCERGVAIIVGVGFTVISTVIEVPLVPSIEGVMIYRTTATELVLFVNI